eukprot:PhF_6_TR36470/c1_g5_i3/m.53523
MKTVLFLFFIGSCVSQQLYFEDGLGFGGRRNSTNRIRDDHLIQSFNTWPVGFVKDVNAFVGGAFDGTSLWLVPSYEDRVVRLNTTSGAMSGFMSWPSGFTRPTTNAFAGAVYDGTSIWLIPHNADRLIDVDLNGGMVGFNSWPSGFVVG